MPVDVRLSKAEEEEAMEQFKDYLPEPGSGASLFDDWNEMAPDCLDRCTIPDRSVAKKDRKRSRTGKQ